MFLLLALLIAFFVATPATLTYEVTVEATPAAETGYAHPEWLVDGAWLQAHLSEVKVVALTDATEFAIGHIPGAAQIDWKDLSIVETGDQQVATWRSEVETKLTALGIAPADTVVVYDDGTFYGARLWWVLDQLGHRDKRILNGGFDAWTGSGGAIETGAPAVQPAATPYVGTPNEESIATIAEVQTALDDPNSVLIDARTPKEFLDGHIPGAVNIEFLANTIGSGSTEWKSAAELRALYEAAGVTPDKSVIPYCTTGVRSAATYFTLRLLGYEHVALFTGSFKEWSSTPGLPIETG